MVAPPPATARDEVEGDMPDRGVEREAAGTGRGIEEQGREGRRDPPVDVPAHDGVPARPEVGLRGRVGTRGVVGERDGILGGVVALEGGCRQTAVDHRAATRRSRGGGEGVGVREEGKRLLGGSEPREADAHAPHGLDVGLHRGQGEGIGAEELGAEGEDGVDIPHAASAGGSGLHAVAIPGDEAAVAESLPLDTEVTAYRRAPEAVSSGCNCGAASISTWSTRLVQISESGLALTASSPKAEAERVIGEVCE